MITMKICDSRQLHGRTAEESILLNSYFASLSLCSSSSPSTSSSLSGDSSNASIILICGDSGVGKSKIAETLKPHVIEDDGYFLRGKFDQLSYFCGDVCSEISGGASSENHSSYSTLKNSNSPHIPYSGIASAFSDYCDQLERRGPDDWKEVTDKLRAVIKKEEGRVLYEAIPALKKILTCDNLHDTDDEEQDVTSNSSERLRRKSESSAVLQKKSRSFTLSTTLSSNSLFRNLHDQEEEKERSDTSINHEEDDFQSESRSHRLNYLMKKFIHAISTVGDPIVLLIDDMHWADPSSLELIRTLILGAKNPFTFLFTYRPVQPSHPFLQMIQDLQHTHVSKTEIQLRNLREESVRELVANLLSIDLRNERLIERKFRNVVKECEEVKDIGVEKEKSIIKASCNCCMGSRIKKIKSQGGSEPEDLSHPCTSLQRLTSAVCSITNGNPFFIRQQIICWIDQGLLRLDKKQHRWVWDIEKIRECTVLNDVVSMVSEKIRRLPESTQHALKICACIGSKIDLHILGLLLREIFLTQCDIDDNEILAEREIQCAIQEGLLVKSPDRTGVIFVHDSIQSAAYSLLDTDNQSSFHLQLGRLLETKLSPCIYQQHFFTIANQLARGYKLITEREERIDAMQIFLMAGEKSRAASAFPEAQFFFARGIFLIRDEVDWKDNYRMCIDCCSKAAEAAALTGDYEKMDEWLNIVLLRSKELDDQLRAYYIRVKALASQAEMEPAVDAGLEAMKLVGVKMPSRNVLMHTLFVLAKTRCLMKRKCVEDLLQLPPIEERHMIPALRLMNLLSTLSASGKRTLCPLICFKSVQLNMKYGMTEGTPASIALYGALLLRFGFPITEAAKYSEMATTLQERLGYKETIANVTMLTYGIVFPFTKPLSECLKPLPDACMTGLEYGDVMHGLRCLSCYAWITYHSAGQPLPQFVNTIQRFSKYSIEYNSTSTLLALKVFVQVCANFMGSIGASHNPANLVGDHFDLDTVSSETPCKTHMLLLEQSQLMQIILGYFFGDYEKAWMASEKLRATGATSFAGLMFPYFLAFYRGLTALAQWDILKSRNFMKVAKSCLNEMKTGQKNSPINLSHSYYLLKAEYSVAKKRHGLAERFFSLSIRHAAEGKVLHEQALACERFGFYYLRRNNHEAAYEQIRAAYDLYRKWGGRAKSESLKKRFPHLADARRNHEVHINQKKTLS